jgi:hypothetical protein
LSAYETLKNFNIYFREFSEEGKERLLKRLKRQSLMLQEGILVYYKTAPFDVVLRKDFLDSQVLNIGA